MLRLFYNPKFNNYLLITYLVLLSIAAWVYCYLERLVLVYNDAMSYQNIARLVVDNQSPGLAQIGTVWLPLSHILKLPLIWNEWAWHSGFAGSIVSMISYILMVIGIYLIVHELTLNRLASIVAAMVAALNLNALYLQTTPLTEPLYLAFYVYGVYFLIRYLKTGHNKYLVPLAFNAALQLLTRYDGWFMAAIIALVIFCYELWQRRQGLQKAIGQTMLFVAPVLFACLVWIGWNALTFGDPFYFARGPFSARAQQSVIEAETGLAAKGDILVSAQTYAYAAGDNVGWILAGVALLGWLVFLFSRAKHEPGLRLVALAVLAGVVIFNIMALYLGFSLIHVPQLHPDNPDAASSLFNIRYGLLALPLASVGAGLLASRIKYATAVVLIAIVAQGAITYQEKPITLRDGLHGSSAFVYHDLSAELEKRVGPGDEVLTSMYQFTPAVFASNIPLRQFIHEGIADQWHEVASSPQDDAEWILVSNGESRDLLHSILMSQHNRAFERHYQLVYEDQHAKLYQRTSSTAVYNP